MEDCPRWSWSAKKYGIREFAELFYDQLPMIVKIEESSNDDEYEKTPLITQSVCCIHSIHLQPRVVTRPIADQQYISIPTKYPFRFHTIDCDGSLANDPLTIAELLTGHSPDPKGLRIQIAEADQLSLPEKIECDLFGPLIVTGTYSEKYLLTSRLDFKDASVTTLATYLPLEISVLSTNAGPEDFEEFQRKVFASIATPKYEENPEELLIFSHPPNDDDYEIILPPNLARISIQEFRESKQHKPKVSQSAKESISIQPPILPERPIGQTSVFVSRKQLSLDQDARNHELLNIRKSKPERATGKEDNDEIYEDFVPRGSKTRSPDHEVTKTKTHRTEPDHWCPLESETAPNPCVDGFFGSNHKASKKLMRRLNSEKDLKSNCRRPSSDKILLLQSDSGSQPFNCPDLSNELVLREASSSSELPFRDSKKERISCKKQKNTATPRQYTSSTILGLSWSIFKPFKKRSSEKSNIWETGRQKGGNSCDPAARFGTGLDSAAEEDAIKSHTRSLTERASTTIASSDIEETPNPPNTCKGHDLSANQLTGPLSFKAESVNEPSISTRRKNKILDNVTNLQENASKSVKPSSEQSSKNPNVSLSSHAIKIRQESIASLSDVPSDITTLSVGEIARCLSLLNLDQYVQLFQEHQVDGVLLGCLDEDVLMQDFGLKRFDAIKLSKFAHKGWRPKVEGT